MSGWTGSRLDWEQKLRHHLTVFRRINLDAIDASIAGARGVVIDWQVDEVASARERALNLLMEGKFDAAMEAGQALHYLASSLHNALINQRPLQLAEKVVEGGKRGAAKTTGARVSTAKRPKIEAAIKEYKGAPRAMAGIISKKFNVEPAYVRKIKAQLDLP